MRRALALSLLLVLAAAPAHAASGCDGLTAKLIRATGASLAGRSGSLSVFRAADAERVSLDCRTPARMVFGDLAREPRPEFFVLVGLAAAGLTGTRARDAELLALQLHQDSLLSGEPREGVTGRAAIRCETGPREDGLADDLTVCVLAPRSAVRQSAVTLSRRF